HPRVVRDGGRRHRQEPPGQGQARPRGVTRLDHAPEGHLDVIPSTEIANGGDACQERRPRGPRGVTQHLVVGPPGTRTGAGVLPPSVVGATSRPPCSAVHRSWPHAASIARPRVSRTVTFTPFD